jgi:hypothetical protein
MGKSLIIKGADFSANAVPSYTYNWYITEYTDISNKAHLTQTFDVQYGGFSSVSWDALKGKTINCMKCKCANAGTFTICVSSDLTTTPRLQQSITFSAEDAGREVVKAFNNITIASNEYVYVAPPTDSRCTYFTQNNTETLYKLRLYCGRSNYQERTSPSHNLALDFGYREELL